MLSDTLSHDCLFTNDVFYQIKYSLVCRKAISLCDSMFLLVLALLYNDIISIFGIDVLKQWRSVLKCISNYNAQMNMLWAHHVTFGTLYVLYIS